MTSGTGPSRPCCEHGPEDHDQHGCAVDVSVVSRVYERCHGLGERSESGGWLARRAAEAEAALRAAGERGDHLGPAARLLLELTPMQIAKRACEHGMRYRGTGRACGYCLAVAEMATDTLNEALEASRKGST